MKPIIVYIMGPTCAGKSIALEAAKTKWGDNLGLVEVGKAFRAKYPPSYFAGQASPTHTRGEAVDMYYQFVERELAKPNVRIILVDGQPRQDQVVPILARHQNYRKVFLHLDAPVEVRRARLPGRFPDGGEALELATRRIDNDRLTYYDTLVDLLKQKVQVRVIDTGMPIHWWTEEMISILEGEMVLR